MNNAKLQIDPKLFADRLEYGPLTPFEETLKAFICSDYSDLLDVDPWLRTARLNAKGRRIVLPILRRALRIYQSPLLMQHWAEVYPCAFEWAFNYFWEWQESNVPIAQRNSVSQIYQQAAG